MHHSLLALAAISPVPAPGTPSLIPHRGPATAEVRQLASAVTRCTQRASSPCSARTGRTTPAAARSASPPVRRIG